MTARGALAGLLGTWLLAVPATSTGTQSVDPNDNRVAIAVRRALAGYGDYTIFDNVVGSVADGVVTLTGKVTAGHKRDDLEAVVGCVAGVTGIVNRLDVLPVSRLDDELRRNIARAIYGNPSFWPYAVMTNPPIHILVEHGHVTLTGVVRSHVDRMLARAIAGSLGALSVTNALETEAELEARLGVSPT